MTTETKWTPGPYHRTKNNTRQISDKRGFKIGKCLLKTKGANFEISEEEAEANAALFAAAPDMAEALKPFEALAKHHVADSPEWRDFDSISVMVTIGDLRAVCAALAKARGEA